MQVWQCISDMICVLRKLHSLHKDYILVLPVSQKDTQFMQSYVVVLYCGSIWRVVASGVPIANQRSNGLSKVLKVMFAIGLGLCLLKERKKEATSFTHRDRHLIGTNLFIGTNRSDWCSKGIQFKSNLNWHLQPRIIDFIKNNLFLSLKNFKHFLYPPLPFLLFCILCFHSFAVFLIVQFFFHRAFLVLPICFPDSFSFHFWFPLPCLCIFILLSDLGQLL